MHAEYIIRCTLFQPHNKSEVILHNLIFEKGFNLVYFPPPSVSNLLLEISNAFMQNLMYPEYNVIK